MRGNDTIADIDRIFRYHFEDGGHCDGACQVEGHVWVRTLLAHIEKQEIEIEVIRGALEATCRQLADATVDALPQEESMGLDMATRQSLFRYLKNCLKRWEHDYINQRYIKAQ